MHHFRTGHLETNVLNLVYRKVLNFADIVHLLIETIGYPGYPCRARKNTATRGLVSAHLLCTGLQRLRINVGTSGFARRTEARLPRARSNRHPEGVVRRLL